MLILKIVQVQELELKSYYWLLGMHFCCLLCSLYLSFPLILLTDWLLCVLFFMLLIYGSLLLLSSLTLSELFRFYYIAYVSISNILCSNRGCLMCPFVIRWQKKTNIASMCHVLFQSSDSPDLKLHHHLLIHWTDSMANTDTVSVRVFSLNCWSVDALYRDF